MPVRLTCIHQGCLRVRNGADACDAGRCEADLLSVDESSIREKDARLQDAMSKCVGVVNSALRDIRIILCPLWIDWRGLSRLSPSPSLVLRVQIPGTPFPSELKVMLSQFGCVRFSADNELVVTITQEKFDAWIRKQEVYDPKPDGRNVGD